MPDTLHLGLPLIEAAQSQKHVTHNEALAELDAAVHLSVISRALAAPPAAPADGDRYLIASGPGGAWAGHAGEISHWLDGAWRFFVPGVGWRCWSEAEAKLLVFDGAIWRDVAVADELQNVSLVGVNATADAANRLTVSSAAVLLNHAGAGHRLKINKSAAADTASILFQDGFSGRAEFGLAGDDDFHVKVSADGSLWTAAITIDRETGVVNFPAGYTPSGGGGTAAEAEIDFGSSGARSKKFTVAAAGVTAASRIIVTQSGKAATGRSSDENEMDALMLRAVPGAGAFTLYADALTGLVNGKFKINYMVG
jgi:Protein of unknown function (DUF2793)